MTTAIVVGGGIAGMSAAKVLADFFDEVVLLERDRYPDGIDDRRGVPQGRMFHTLLERGRREIEAIFPGFHKLLDERKMPKVSFGFNCALMTPHGWGRNVPVPVQRSLFCTRSLLESTMRDLFLRDPRVELIERCTATGLLVDNRSDGKTCVGVRYKRRQGKEEQALTGDFVLDASGAGSKASHWLREIGVEPPAERELDPLLTYGGRYYKLRAGARFPKAWWWTHGAFIQRVPPSDAQAAHMIRQEADLWLLTLVAGDELDIPTDDPSIDAFLGQMRSPLIRDMLPYFEPVGTLTSYRLPKNRWRCYETWKEEVHGFAAIGAATCVFNPNQGQGMSVAAADASLLRACLEQTTSPKALPRLFFKEQAAFQRNAYELACRNDLRFHAVQGKRTARVRFFNWYRDQITRAGASDSWIARSASEVDLLLEPMTRLYRPGFVARVLFARLALWWRANPAPVERTAPIPPAPAEIPSSWTRHLRDAFGVAIRFAAYRLGLAR